MKQINLLEELIVDNFAGGGGASTGIELATGRPVDIAINHDPDAIAMHKANHPYTTHYCESVWDVDPKKVCRGRKVGLAWFSPDCKHFSKAKGGKPVDKNIRGLAWIVLKWAGTVRPRVIILENVEEFQTWGPVRKGKPVKSRAGETFRKWKEQLESLGYCIEHRELVAADYGAPTIRKRFFLIARCDGKPIIFPEKTHAPVGSEEVKEGRKKTWRSAAEIIDWSLPCPSIFDTSAEIKDKYGIRAVRPLAENTIKRIIRGLDKFVLNTSAPFLVMVNHTGEFRGQEITDPVQTVTAKNGYGLVSPILEPYSIWTVSKAEQCLLMPSLIQYHTEQSEKARGQKVTEPLMTLDASNRYGVSAAYLTKYYGNEKGGISAADPLHTVTAKDREAVTAVHMEKFYSGGYTGCGSSAKEPLGTITAVDHNGISATFLSKFYKTGIGQETSDPLHTITTSPGHFGLTIVKLERENTDLGHWNEIRELLNQYADYKIGCDEILLISIKNQKYFISDIGLRMLTPKELYAANGFPADYIIDKDCDGKTYGKTNQVARCGNAVPPPFAEALVRANLPEMCGEKIGSMGMLKKIMVG
nr:MAG TPA: DNA cytosine methyltransferase [Caudoviricetes sp.]